MNFRVMRQCVLLCQTLLLAACSTQHILVDTPNLYTEGNTSYPAEKISASTQTVSPDVFYITDRKANVNSEYESARSASMAFGAVKMNFGDNLSWEELAKLSSTKNRNQDIELKITDTQEITRFPETPLPFEMLDGQFVTTKKAASAYENSTQILQKKIGERLKESEDKDIIFYVHGFNNSFDTSAYNLADIWHFTGRHGVPVFYSWPAAHGGLLGYFIDSESGEYSIYHLKETIRILAEIPELENLHIIAHSRGTALVSSAIRELVIEKRASGKSARDILKLKNVILAAPDLDVGVVHQRLAAERLETEIGQITVYMNSGDEALGLSQYLVDGLRFGRLTEQDLSNNEKQRLNQIQNVAFINVEGVSGLIGHSYYREHTGALSDIALLIKNGSKPGDRERPLLQIEGNFWTLPKEYPNKRF